MNKRQYKKKLSKKVNLRLMAISFGVTVKELLRTTKFRNYHNKKVTINGEIAYITGDSVIFYN